MDTEKSFDYLNVIPLVDVMLVLLTIVLTTSTFIATGGIQVELPKASSENKPSPLHPKSVVIDREEHIWLEGTQVSLEELSTELAAANRETPVLVRADKSIALQGFVDVFAAIKNLGFSHLSLQTEQQP
ncbi:biopolymer transporter ExbD [Desulfobulbus rhabdoformis]|uniref:ExbD/TolR family protein n=1 Tax=Desulfobulbus rhabdoformis TaxID=34032 RepID=UPI00196310D0|nr:biopolymer transporter ExbD [Desulfobulbus rhabdoformis]MBM9615523.1 biopolymer transporter ExbD [Desulfobulbus rhabdoformis]